ncbi:MAG: amino acid permease [Candidatus Bathyarchaeia archaeon]|jgi:amino acid transporter
MSQSIEEKLFARKASGLVKEASTAQATIWNIGNIFGSKFAWSVAYLGLFPAGLIFSYSPYLWGVLFIGLADCVLGICYIQITTPMPRSGADYVIPARIMGPFWGWISSWMKVWAVIPLWAFMSWVTLRNIKQLVDILRVAGVTTANIPWLLSAPAAAWVGSIIVIVGMLVCMMPPRRYYMLIAVLGVLSILGIIIVAAGTSIVSQPVFGQNMKTLMGVSPQELISTATSKGFDPNGTYDVGSTAGLMGFLLFAAGGFQYSAGISGELRGNVKKTLTVSILGSLAFFIVYCLAFMWLVLSQFGYNFTVAWSYLFWKTSAAPLSLPPINALLSMIAAPNLWPLWTVAAIAGTVGTWLYIPTSMLYINRMVFSWGVDRMVPKAFSDVHPRFRQPLKAVLFEGILALAFFLILIYFNFNPVNYGFWSVLLGFPIYVFPAICALLLAKRRPDLMKAVPWRKWMVPVAILWLVIIIPFYLFSLLIGGVPPMKPGLSFFEYALSTGLVASAFVIIVGIATFFFVRRYNLKRGIDFKQIFQTIPPE